ncbi:MAG: hypothetical protein HZC43_04520 [Nitrosomonadales bacterium]|nr:hypothetical protein [Nitrosomonadales bacterium]
MNMPEEERRERNIRRAAGMRALKEIRGIVDEGIREEAARRKWLRALLRYGGIILLLVAGLLARYLGVI